MEGDESVGISNMMKMRCIMKGIGERGIACYLIHLQGILRRQKSPDMNKNDAMKFQLHLDVMVLSNCGTGKYCTARKIDKRMNKNKGIDGTKA